MLVRKNGTEVLRIDLHVVPIPPFRIDVPASSEGIRFSAKAARAEADNEVEMVEEFRPAGLSARKKFHGGEILKILMICDDINRKGGALEIVPPSAEGFIDG